MKVREFIKKVLVVVAAILVGATPVSTTYAAQTLQERDPGTYRSFSQNNIMFYDPGGGCTPRSSIAADSVYNPDEVGWYWNGGCSVVSAHVQEILERDINDIMAAAKQYGVPWEVIPAQAWNESGWRVRDGNGNPTVFGTCNNPLGIKTGEDKDKCYGGDGLRYKKYAKVQDSYYDYAQIALGVKEAIETGLYADKPYSFIEYVQYGGTYSYAYCESGYSMCEGFPNGVPTPTYVNSVSANICGIQKWAKENGIEISGETKENFVDPMIDTRLGGANDGSSASAGYCSNTGDWGEGGMRIANAAVALAWPYQEDDTCIKKWDATVFDSDLPTKNKWMRLNANNEGARINWSSNPSMCKYSVKPEYAEAKKTYNIGGTDTDCGSFVITVLNAAGFGDTFNSSRGMYFNEDLENSPLWENVTDIYDNDTANLLPGDVFHTVQATGHTLIWVGKIPANVYGKNIASASQGGRTGDLSVDGFTTDKRPYYVYRYVGEISAVDDKKDDGEE